MKYFPFLQLGFSLIVLISACSMQQSRNCKVKMHMLSHHHCNNASSCQRASQGLPVGVNSILLLLPSGFLFCELRLSFREDVENGVKMNHRAMRYLVWHVNQMSSWLKSLLFASTVKSLTAIFNFIHLFLSAPFWCLKIRHLRDSVAVIVCGRREQDFYELILAWKANYKKLLL